MKPEKYDNILPYTRHTVEKIDEKKHLFTACTIEKSNKLLVFQKDAEVKNNIFRTVEADNEITQAKLDKVNSDAHQLFAITYGILGKIDRSLTKIYFKDSKPHLAKGDMSEILRALQRGYVIIKNDDYTDLDIYKDQYVSMIALLEENLPIERTIKNKHNEAKDNLTKAIMAWTVLYASLKYYVKGDLVNTNEDWGEFFLDLIQQRAANAAKKKGSTILDSAKDDSSKEENLLENHKEDDNIIDSL